MLSLYVCSSSNLSGHMKLVKSEIFNIDFKVFSFYRGLTKMGFFYSTAESFEDKKAQKIYFFFAYNGNLPLVILTALLAILFIWSYQTIA